MATGNPEFGAFVVTSTLASCANGATIEVRSKLGDTGILLMQQALTAAMPTASVDHLLIDSPGCSPVAGRHLQGAVSSRACRTLRSLRLIRWPFERGSDVAGVIRQLLPLQRLRVLTLDNCGIVGAGLIPLSALIHTGVIEQLALPRNCLTSGEDLPPCGLAPATPSVVGLDGQPLPPGAAPASPGRRAHSAVSTPTAPQRPPNQQQQQRDELAIALFQTLSGRWVMNTSVYGVHLGRAAQVFGTSLCSPYGRLSRLDLSFSCLTDDIGIPIAAALTVNATLQFLDVSHNRLTGLFARCLAQSLQSNETLRELRAGFQPLGIEGCKALLQVGGRWRLRERGAL